MFKSFDDILEDIVESDISLEVVGVVTAAAWLAYFFADALVGVQ